MDDNWKEKEEIKLLLELIASACPHRAQPQQEDLAEGARPLGFVKFLFQRHHPAAFRKLKRVSKLCSSS